MCCILFWTIASPVVGVVAIIVALWVARKSSLDSQQQIAAVYKLLDVFVAAQAPTMMEAKLKYQQELKELDQQIDDLNEEIKFKTIPAGGLEMDKIDAVKEQYKQIMELKALEDKREETQQKYDLILSYIDKAKTNKK